MKILYITVLGIVLFSLTSAIKADDYKVYRIHKLETIPMKHELAKKVVPVIRTYISNHGHIAHLEGSDNLVIKATPYSINKLRKILSTVTLDNFNSDKLRSEMSGELFRKDDSFVSRTVELNNVRAGKVVAGLRHLVSNGNLSIIEGTNNLKITDYPDFVEEMIRLITKLDGAQS